jgi:SAM-dependent methyltransferase
MHLLSLFTNISTRVTPELESTMEYFYATSDTYTAYQEESTHEAFWKLIKRSLHSGGPLNVLEVGAGKTGAYRVFGSCPGLHYYAHDINSRNYEHFARNHIKQFDDDGGIFAHVRFDAIFSTYVFEHVPHPEKFLERQLSLLKPGGAVYILCPNYEYGARNPSFDNCTFVGRVFTRMLFPIVARVNSIVNRSVFYFNTRPAIDSLQWTPDRDAIHIVSTLTLKTWCRRRNLRLSVISLKNWLTPANIKYNLMTCCVRIQYS